MYAVDNESMTNFADRRCDIHTAVELFSGCGGLAYGLCQAGIVPEIMIESNPAAVQTLNLNVEAGAEHISDWQPKSCDVREMNWSPYRGRISVVAGGPPCQPFSIGGLHKGDIDSRDMWPEAIRAVNDICPRAFLFENVRGLLRESFSSYFKTTLSALANAGNGYQVAFVRVDAADYGAAQRRHRVIVAGVESTSEPMLSFPVPTHSRDRLLWDQFVSGDYWARHSIQPPIAKQCLAPADYNLVERLRHQPRAPATEPWRTVRDALRGLGEPDGINHHVLRTGARSYAGHTGSYLDMPAKTIKAGTHGVPGGENMLRSSDGSVRYFTIREAARLQGLPDNFIFPGTWSESMRQLGNAVPTELARAFGAWLIHALKRR